MRLLPVLPLLLLVSAVGAERTASLKVLISWGHDAAQAQRYWVKPEPADDRLKVRNAVGVLLEAGEVEREGAWETNAGGGDIDGVEFELEYDSTPDKPVDNLHIIWSDLIAAADADTARRLSREPALRVNPQKLTVRMNPEGTRGFSVTVEQLLAEGALWIPSHGVYISTGDRMLPFEEHQNALQNGMHRRVLDEVRREPEATYRKYTALWEDMGHPAYTNPQQRGPGHIVGVTWDSAIAKFGVDRGAGVWNDYGNPDKFQFWFDFADLTKGITPYWKGQSLKDGLPVITTVLEREGVRYEIEQFAYPLNGPPPSRRGDIQMVLFQKVRLTDLTGEPREIPVRMAHRRQFPSHVNSTIEMERQGNTALFREAGYRRALLSVEAPEGELYWSGTRDYQREQKRIDATLILNLPAKGSREFVVKLPSPPVEPEDTAKLTGLDFAAARASTLKFWSGYVARGAQFLVPEKAVNDLFRASLWHALRLPRRHGGEGGDVRIDLPYSNFAYSQTGTPWPVNQAVYVDYMIYDLRGYHGISAEELLAQFRNNQERDGHVNGYANWLVYTPSMLYSVAQNYLLSADRAAFDRLLPYSLKALDWCLAHQRDAERLPARVRGLAHGPLNDGTGDGFWAFNQAYMYAGLDIFGKALEMAGHPRAAEARRAASAIRESIDRAFHAASVSSPLVQLRDHTWIPYVPSEAGSSRRLMEQWYPTDIDTGAVHMIRLKAVDPGGDLASWLLDDHEDNLYFRNWGAANEPVYNQHATAHLWRDDPAAVVRAFYSYMASAFSHSALEPVEHRWTHGQYFGPPSTDGAWFELFRNMLVHERDDGSLALAMAAPRAWFENGKKIEVRGAPTWFGPLTMTIESRSVSGTISADVETPSRSRLRALLLRLRHPDGKPMLSVTVNGQNWKDFQPEKDLVRITDPAAAKYTVIARY